MEKKKVPSNHQGFTYFQMNNQHHQEDQDKHLTVAQNRIMDPHQFHTKTTEKYAETERFLPFSSLKKSERSHIAKENLGSLIFETPPKGRGDRYFSNVYSNRFLNEKIDLSPTPLKFEEDN